MPANGSSSRMKRGCVASARAISTRRRSPPDRASAGDLRRCSTRRSCSSALRRSSTSGRRQRLARRVGLQFEHGTHVVLDVELAKDRGLLRQVAQAQPGAPVDRHVGHRAAVDRDVAGTGTHQADQDVERGGLAGAIGAEQADHLAFADRQRDVLDDHAAAVGLLQVPRFQPHAERQAHPPPAPRRPAGSPWCLSRRPSLLVAPQRRRLAQRRRRRRRRGLGRRRAAARIVVARCQHRTHPTAATGRCPPPRARRRPSSRWWCCRTRSPGR